MSDARLYKQDDRTWRVAGDLDLDAVATVLAQGSQMWEDGMPCVVDFSQVRRIDSTSVALMLEWQRQAKQRNIALRYRNVPRQLLAIASVCGVKALLALESQVG
ncbi:MAG: STAS domain-containing protein [Chromatiales bacterium]